MEPGWLAGPSLGFFARKVIERLGRKIGAVRPDHRTAHGIYYYSREILWIAERLEHRTFKHRTEIHRLMGVIVELNAQPVIPSYLSAYNMENVVSHGDYSNGGIGLKGW